jgi:bis(5'-nucleosyl)-tetraphosphatase (symmetrical)
VHAGVPPQWDLPTTLALAGEVEARLRSDDLHDFLSVMYGNGPARWDDALTGNDRLRFAVNALTRMRFIDADGTLELKTSGPPEGQPADHMAWFDAPGRKTQGQPIAFGHWSALGLLDRPDVLGLDTGCVWGGQLTAARIDGGRRELIQVDCDQAQKPD